MSRLDVVMDERAKREKEGALLAIYGGLEDGVSRAGGVLQGLSVKFDGAGCLLTLKAEFPNGCMVGFVGGDDLAHVLRKGAGEAVRDQVKWREDKWRDNGG
jgi:hypothetical protein